MSPTARVKSGLHKINREVPVHPPPPRAGLKLAHSVIVRAISHPLDRFAMLDYTAPRKSTAPKSATLENISSINVAVRKRVVRR